MTELYSTELQSVIGVLKSLISTSRISREEYLASTVVEEWFKERGLSPIRVHNNIICKGLYWDNAKPTIMLNSHIDTVKPVIGWNSDPHTPVIDNERLYGLGSNDAGGALVTLMHTFIKLNMREQSYNILFVASAEEEVSGTDGMKSVVKLFGKSLPNISLAIVGEPTNMQPAIAEKGLMVIDVDVEGRAAHAARNEGINAIYRAMDAISIIRNIPQELRSSTLLGEVKMTVTIIQSGLQHNVIPDNCRFTIDIRGNELYSNTELLNIVSASLPTYCRPQPRSTLLNSSSLLQDGAAPNHLSQGIIDRFTSMGLTPFGSPTLSDQAILSSPSLKIGPGASERSHTANEYIEIRELEQALQIYYNLLNGL